MLNYSKKILEAVSFDNELFKKEYSKLTDWLSQEEGQTLLTWCLDTFDYDLLMQAGLLF
jgi:hypothetical protein